MMDARLHERGELPIPNPRPHISKQTSVDEHGYLVGSAQPHKKHISTVPQINPPSGNNNDGFVEVYECEDLQSSNESTSSAYLEVVRLGRCQLESDGYVKPDNQLESDGYVDTDTPNGASKNSVDYSNESSSSAYLEVARIGNCQLESDDSLKPGKSKSDNNSSDYIHPYAKRIQSLKENPRNSATYDDADSVDNDKAKVDHNHLLENSNWKIQIEEETNSNENTQNEVKDKFDPFTNWTIDTGNSSDKIVPNDTNDPHHYDVDEDYEAINIKKRDHGETYSPLVRNNGMPLTLADTNFDIEEKKPVAPWSGFSLAEISNNNAKDIEAGQLPKQNQLVGTGNAVTLVANGGVQNSYPNVTEPSAINIVHNVTTPPEKQKARHNILVVISIIMACIFFWAFPCGIIGCLLAKQANARSREGNQKAAKKIAIVAIVFVIFTFLTAATAVLAPVIYFINLSKS